MKLPRDLSGDQFVQLLKALGFEKIRHSGSHMTLKHDSTGETITVPSHHVLKVGTLSGLIRDVQEITGLKREEVLKSLGF